MSRDWRLYVDDILEAIGKIGDYTEGMYLSGNSKSPNVARRPLRGQLSCA